MHLALTVVLWASAIALAIPACVLMIEAFAAVGGRRRSALAVTQAPTQQAPTQQRPMGHKPIAATVLIPAHDEAHGIADTVAHVLARVASAASARPGDRWRVIVIADNCTDSTAELARAAGAEVLERRLASERGKAFALAHGVRALDGDPPDVVVVVDADCRLEAGVLETIAPMAVAQGRPAQALYLLTLPPSPGVRDRISAFAFLFKNQVRALGLSALSLPCHLTGTGMAFPWSALRRVPLASSSIVEDLEYGLKLAMAGAPPVLCGDARIWSQLPQQASAATSQRRRWEHGFLSTMLELAPRVIASGLRRGDVGLCALGLDLLVPPLSLFAMLLGATTAIALVLASLGVASPAPALFLLLLAAGCALAVLAAWSQFGRALIPLATLLGAPLYVLWKIPIYVSFLFRRERRWVRTERDQEAPPNGR